MDPAKATSRDLPPRRPRRQVVSGPYLAMTWPSLYVYLCRSAPGATDVEVRITLATVRANWTLRKVTELRWEASRYRRLLRRAERERDRARERQVWAVMDFLDCLHDYGDACDDFDALWREDCFLAHAYLASVKRGLPRSVAVLLRVASRPLPTSARAKKEATYAFRLWTERGRRLWASAYAHECDRHGLPAWLVLAGYRLVRATRGLEQSRATTSYDAQLWSAYEDYAYVRERYQAALQLLADAGRDLLVARFLKRASSGDDEEPSPGARAQGAAS